MKISYDWLHLPRESFDAGGWDEMVGPEFMIAMPSPDNKYPRSVCVSRCLEGPRRIFHFRVVDLALPRPPPTIPEATVDLFEMMGLFPPIRREGKPSLFVKLVCGLICSGCSH
jgi:hypothetical protein